MLDTKLMIPFSDGLHANTAPLKSQQPLMQSRGQLVVQFS